MLCSKKTIISICVTNVTNVGGSKQDFFVISSFVICTFSES